MAGRKLVKIKYAKVEPLLTFEVPVHDEGYCPAHLFQAKKGYEQVPLHFLSTVPDKAIIQQPRHTSSMFVSTFNETNNGSLRKSLSQSGKPRLHYESKFKDIYKYSMGDNSTQKNNTVTPKKTEIELSKGKKKQRAEERNLSSLRELRSKFLKNARKFFVNRISHSSVKREKNYTSFDCLYSPARHTKSYISVFHIGLMTCFVFPAV